ncbi:MAG: DUF4446 family protein, partial [Candidatus Azambacteria bacterium]|nr:DUF4446 family protein [Candidatus Azambacteria bacterium]
ELTTISLNTILLIGLTGIVMILAVWNIMLARKFKALFRGSTGAALEKIIESQVKRTTKLEGEAKRQLEEILALRTDFLCSFQKVKVARFNSFDETGTNQSFAIIALDGHNTGLILTNLYLNNAARVFVKPITRGEAQQKLSPEEQTLLTDILQ